MKMAWFPPGLGYGYRTPYREARAWQTSAGRRLELPEPLLRNVRGGQGRLLAETIQELPLRRLALYLGVHKDHLSRVALRRGREVDRFRGLHELGQPAPQLGLQVVLV